MHKPHDYPVRVRFWHFLRGLLFYNTVYWKRASDELKPPRLSREERNNLQPAPDPDIVRPRERPRANPSPDAPPPMAVVPAPIARPERRPVQPPPWPVESDVSLPTADGDDIIVKRRRYRRRKKNVHASRSPAILAASRKPGFFARWFGSGD